jgi:hypothetical protein
MPGQARTPSHLLPTLERSFIVTVPVALEGLGAVPVFTAPFDCVIEAASLFSLDNPDGANAAANTGLLSRIPAGGSATGTPVSDNVDFSSRANFVTNLPLKTVGGVPSENIMNAGQVMTVTHATGTWSWGGTQIVTLVVTPLVSPRVN